MKGFDTVDVERMFPLLGESGNEGHCLNISTHPFKAGIEQQSFQPEERESFNRRTGFLAHYVHADHQEPSILVVAFYALVIHTRKDASSILLDTCLHHISWHSVP